MKIVYAVSYIEVEFGQRDEGYRLYTDVNECIKKTKEASARGSCGEGYYGPERPLYYVEVPYDSLEKELQTKFLESDVVHTTERWQPRFSGSRVMI